MKWPRRTHFRNKFYFGLNLTYNVGADGVDPAILSVNRQMHQEASRILFSENCFNFCSGNKYHKFYTSEVVMPFLKDLSEVSRGLIKQVKFDCNLSKFSEFLVRFTAYSPPVFEENCDYLCQNLQLEHVTLRYIDMSVDGSLGGTDEENRKILSQQHWIQ